MSVNTHFPDTIFTSPTSLWLNLCIIYIFFKHNPSSCDILGKLKECRLEGMSQFLLNILHKPSPYVLPSGQGTLVAPQAHKESLVPKIPPPPLPPERAFMFWLTMA